MTDGDTAACQFDHDIERKSALVVIDIARDGGDRSDLPQLADCGSIANVLGVKNGIDAF